MTDWKTMQKTYGGLLAAVFIVLILVLSIVPTGYAIAGKTTTSGIRTWWPLSIMKPAITAPPKANTEVVSVNPADGKFIMTYKPGETNKAFVSFGSVKSRTTTLAAPGPGPRFPDLTAELIESKYSVETDIGIITFKVINNGYASAAGPFTVRVVYPAGANNPYIIDVPITGQLPPRSEILVFVGALDYKYWYGITPGKEQVIVDSDNNVLESNENNNAFTWQLNFIDTCDKPSFIKYSGVPASGGPDLQPAVTTAAYSEGFKLIECRSPIGNMGDKGTGPFDFNMKVTGPGLNLDTNWHYPYSLNPRDVAENRFFVFFLNDGLPNVAPYQCTLTADTNNIIKETNENNNVASGAFYGGNKCGGGCIGKECPVIQ